MTKTVFPKPADKQVKWHILDAKGQVLGRMATKIAHVLRGKNKTFFTPNTDTGDFIVVINAKEIVLKGKKFHSKFYHSHSGYAAGLKNIRAGKLLEKHPERLISKAVSGMLPKNLLSKKLLGKLKIYPGADHPHGAQNPTPL